MLDPEKWADGIEAERKEAISAEAIRQQAFLARREIFKQDAPQLWGKIREAFDNFCETYNKRRDVLYRADIGSTFFVVRRKDIPIVMVEVVQLPEYRLNVTIGKIYKASYEAKVFENGHGTVSYTHDNRPITPEEIAATSLERFLKTCP